jgi:hypothetical protein
MPRYFGHKTVRVAAYNWRAARYFHELAARNPEGSFFTAKASLVFSAFTFEAFLNQLGQRLLKDWLSHDRKSYVGKLNVICRAIPYVPPMGGRPYQTLKPLFRFRNQVAHGRDEVITAAGVRVHQGIPTMDTIQADWESYCTVPNAKRALDDVHAAATDLARRANVPTNVDYPFGAMASSVGHIAPCRLTTSTEFPVKLRKMF